MILSQFRSVLVVLMCLLFVHKGTVAQKKYDEKQIGVSMRAIGHQFLLKLNDSTSRVLPIEKNGQQYKIPFEAQFQINPDDLIETVNDNLKGLTVAKAYILEVQDVRTGAVAYSYEIDSAKQMNMVPCRGRMLPEARYNILITIKKEGIAFNSNNRPNRRSANGGLFNRSFIIYILLFLLALGSVLFFFLKKKKTIPEPEDDEELDPNIIIIGQYQFDKRSSVLSLNDKKEELSGKEAELLLTLIAKVNETQERDELLRKVWGDEGDYIGRTLDVFISKLRKKLEGDPKIKIVNIRGVGYKLVLED